MYLLHGGLEVVWFTHFIPETALQVMMKFGVEGVHYKGCWTNFIRNHYQYAIVTACSKASS
jgi:hypothetical protein